MSADILALCQIQNEKETFARMLDAKRRAVERARAELARLELELSTLTTQLKIAAKQNQSDRARALPGRLAQATDSLVGEAA